MSRNLSLSFLTALALAGAGHAATNFSYDAYVTPGTLPTAVSPAWLTDGPFKAGDSQTASGRLLTVVDGSASSLPGFYYYRTLTASDVNSTDEWEMRARVRVPSSGDLLAEGRAPFYLRILDGTKFIGIGVTHISPTVNRFFLVDNVGKPLNTGGGPRFDDVALGGDDFFNIRVVKEGTTGTINDTIRLYVDGVQIENEAYPAFPAISSRDVLWGSLSSPGFGTFELTGVSFSIGGQNAAPALLPEPTSLLLGLLGLLCYARRFRAHR
jgi:hypothetical protein